MLGGLEFVAKLQGKRFVAGRYHVEAKAPGFGKIQGGIANVLACKLTVNVNGRGDVDSRHRVGNLERDAQFDRLRENVRPKQQDDEGDEDCQGHQENQVALHFRAHGR